ncbi:tyrosine-type recombinase/integrase [Fuerstiella marisgermanici]|uniref:Phage integrase family protein n=1 Tax=Fuerstiella marisgermanici TaxID=1891926 RepID=A0A1P8WDM6_9PLAN|nr:tyrosine-type recombinase/integrase [Fuerstiella marisgermanici]APZ92178.1 Phage integrase family protein [Fuerstiella marisgermanici]
MRAYKKTAPPKKPYKEFPLFAHPNGQWSKKIKGKQWHFGLWNDPDAALARYLDEVDEIHAGRDPRRMGVVEVSVEEVTVADAANHYLANLDSRCSAGEVTPRYFMEAKLVAKRLVDYFGRRARVAALRAADFAAYRKAFPDTWGPTRIGVEIQKVRTIFKWCHESEVTTAIPNFGPDFKKPSRAVIRRAKQARQSKHGKLAFEQHELQTILDSCDGWLKAAVFLGLNAGFGAMDCGRLRAQNIDFENGWYDLPRPKTGIPRRFYVWEETREAIKEAMRVRPVAKKDDHDDLCFLTTHGKPVAYTNTSGTVCDNVGEMYRKLLRKLDADDAIKHNGFAKPGRGFYSLRRTYETIAGNSKDQVAVNYAMGHVDDSMAAVYRQGIDDQRLIDVAEHVRKWLFGGEQ